MCDYMPGLGRRRCSSSAHATRASHSDQHPSMADNKRAAAAASVATRKRKKVDEHICIGMESFLDNSIDNDIAYTKAEMNARREIVAPIARMIRDGVIERRLPAQATTETGPVLGRKLGVGCRLFSKIGIKIWRKYFSKICLQLTAHLQDNISEDQLINIGCFSFGVQKSTRLPSTHINAEYELPLLEAMHRRYNELGDRLHGLTNEGFATCFGYFSWDAQHPTVVQSVFDKAPVKCPMARIS